MNLTTISRVGAWFRRLATRVWDRLRPQPGLGEIGGIAADACRTRRELIVENAILRHQINILRRSVKRGRLWGAERIRGELLKLGIKVSKRTIQRYMRTTRTKGGGGQDWKTFLKNHAEATWTCDFVQTYDLFFRQVFAFFFVHLAS